MNRPETLQDILKIAEKEVAKVIIGQKGAVVKALACIFTGQHALVEGVPGIGKTLMVRTLAHVLGCESGRIQFTPDLMPADITGTNIFNLQKGEFTLMKGPVFTSFLLADEINRAPAKTQSALLQAMQEREVTIDRETYLLPPDFTVFATQNPIEYEGTYPLPEAQKDRFMLKITMDYPDAGGELSLARRMLGNDAPESVLAAGGVERAVSDGDLPRYRQSLGNIFVKEALLGYIVEIIRQTRSHESVLVGAGPRATQGLLASSRVMAAVEGRDFVTPDDVKHMAPSIMEHRLVLKPDYEIEGLTVKEVIEDIIKKVNVPR